MTNITFNELLNEHKHLLKDSTYVKVYDFYISGNTDPEKLQGLLFHEETDWIYDSSWDKSDRANGKNAMRQEYTDKMNKKRTSLGVSSLTENGYNPDETSKNFCISIIKNSPKHRDLFLIPQYSIIL